MREKQNSQNHKFMLEYLVSLMDDANGFSWDVEKASQDVLLCQMEQGEVRSYHEIDKTDRITRANVQRHTAQSQCSTQTLNNSRKMPINLPNQCLVSTLIKVPMFTESHMTPKVLYTSTLVLLTLPPMGERTPIQNLKSASCFDDSLS